MKNKLFTLALLSVGFSTFAQVGINTGQPKASLDVVGFPSDANKLDGIIAPRLTGTQLKAKNYTASQTGALVYVTAVDAAPSGQTVNVITPGNYYFDGTLWQRQTGTDWQVKGNANGEIVTTTETLGGAPLSANYLGTKGSADLVLITADKVHGVLDTSGVLAGGGEAGSSMSWGSGNSINTVSNNIALGKGNTANASAATIPAIAIGSGNSATGGGKAFGTGNTAGTANSFAFGANNKTGNSVAVAVGLGNIASNGGFAFGATNTVTLNNFAFGSTNNASGVSGAIAIGIQGTAAADQSVYANKMHVFFNQGNTADTILGINMVPTASTATGAALQIKGISGAANTCTAAEEGAIRYNATAKTHEGCNGTTWKAFY